MTDRELLELAAKAAEIEKGEYRIDCGISTTNSDGRHGYLPRWNPITDDGDAFRLAVKLLFEIDMGRDGIAIRHSTGIKILEAFNNDPYAATRRAIVRAAAEIGKGMK